MSPNWLFLILAVVLVLFVVGPIAVVRSQRKAVGMPGDPNAVPGSPATPPTGLERSPQEAHEDIVRRNWQRPGVVVNGVTLVDLYNRIRALEERLARAEQQPPTPPQP
ncbi:hypothetical protein GCM10009554_39010 [Kribbella koreensis]|uniref:DivIVA domain-containing protein n=1 Tax=Kribbella koreensis TaxID=57909 RepID=A0ABN1QN50_9ACTN